MNDEDEIDCLKQSNIKNIIQHNILWNIFILLRSDKRRQWGLFLSGIECKHIDCEGPIVPQEDWTH